MRITERQEQPKSGGTIRRFQVQLHDNHEFDLEGLLDAPLEELLRILGSTNSGLGSDDAERRLLVYGKNEITRRRRISGIEKLLLMFRNPLIIILVLAGAISGVVGQILNAVIIFSMVLVSVFLLLFQESKAERAADELKEKVSTTATVLRNAQPKEVRIEEVVPGDVFSLSAGDIIPADSRILVSKDLFVDQSSLTGESFPAEKSSRDVSREKPLTERSTCLFLGTSVLNGTASAIAIRTGSSSEYGKIAKKLAERGPETDFERGLRRFGFMIMEITFLLVIFVFFVNALYRRDVLESLLFAVALAVGLTPELLPMILSVNLSRGAIAMSKRGVIVKRLASIQNLGSMDVLCTDKTGTLTENKIVLVLHIDAEGKENERVMLFSYLNSHFQTGLKSPLDEAILRHSNIGTEAYMKIDEIPFDFARKRISVAVENVEKRSLISKGAPEEILNVSTSYEIDGSVAALDTKIRGRLEEKYRELSTQGYRVLGVAFKPAIDPTQTFFSAEDEKEMVFLGFVAFIDPPKKSAKESIRVLNDYGIETKIVTGDNELVTKNVCSQLDVDVKGFVLGSEIAQMQDDALARLVEEANVFARVTPAQKNRIINALKSNGHVVGFLGDGINDSPSLKSSDVGISVNNAVDVAKETADIILSRKSLRVLGDGVIEGRRTFGNTMKYVMMGISSNFGNMFSAAGASLILPFLPMLPTQILLNNMMYDFSESTIPTDNVDQEYIQRPKKWDISYIRNFMILFGLISSVFDFLTFFLMIIVFRANEPLFQTGWFLESFCTESLVIFVIRTRKIPFYASRPSALLLLSTLGLVGVALLLPFTPLGPLFGFIIPPAAFFGFLVLYVVVYLALVELGKRWFYAHYGMRLDQTVSLKRTGRAVGRRFA